MPICCERVEEPARVEHRRDEHADLDAAVERAQAADQQHRGDRDVADERQAGVEDAVEPDRLGGGAPVVLGQPAVDVLDLRLAAERLHGADARHRLDEPHDEPRRRRPLLAVLQLRADLEPAGEHHARDHRDEQHQAAAPVEQHQRHRGEHHREHARGQRGDAAVEQLAQRVDVGGLPRDDPARRVLLVELQAEPLRVPEHPAAQVEQHRLAHPRRRTHGRRREHAAQQRGGEVPERRQRDRPGVAGGERRQRLVDAVRDERRTGDRGELRAHHQRGRPPRGPGDGPQQRGRAARASGAGSAATRPWCSRPRTPSEVRTLAGRAHRCTAVRSSASSSADSAVSTYR